MKCEGVYCSLAIMSYVKKSECIVIIKQLVKYSPEIAKPLPGPVASILEDVGGVGKSFKICEAFFPLRKSHMSEFKYFAAFSAYFTKIIYSFINSTNVCILFLLS